jgi:hypothetical protein
MTTAPSLPEQPLRQGLTAITPGGTEVGLLHAALP